MVERRDVEGTLARWFAVDADSHIGVFTGPYAAWPAAVFADYQTVHDASEFMATTTPTTRAILSEHWLSGAHVDVRTFPNSPPPVDWAEEEAIRGLYSFDADPGYGGQTAYLLDASPVQPLRLQEAPPILQRAASLVRFPSVRFARVTSIDLAGLVPFVVGSG
ncbi:MAG: hypothetical protein R3B13_21410 [Polyangiaceae bacterium]